ncbi:peptidase M24, structural domain-containing protein [Jimgerdemannia flammicorona]|uniref:Peptidase M24, structural domain-containing protein n=1 Tax=Jimgerdemannia flammicorona TaxID=994334 RepID=A0A433DJ69_9FUNG|nr:peptidase M24, structural domain-containing protein [Jimgerdemannia flammicorona]
MDTSMALAYPASKFEADNNLADQNVLLKYRTAADIVNGTTGIECSMETLKLVLNRVAAGASVQDLCQYGDDLIEAYTSKIFNKGKVEKGIAFPTSVCLNNLVQYFSPQAEESDVLKPGDLVKIELGVHIDGYIATAAHTTTLNHDPAQPVTSRQADAICAAHYAAETALRLAKPGVKVR